MSLSSLGPAALAPRAGASIKAPAEVVLETLEALAENPDPDASEVVVTVTTSPEGGGAWSYLSFPEFVPGLAEALSSHLDTVVGTWFSDPRAGFARLDIHQGGELIDTYPSRVSESGSPDPRSLSGSVEGLRKAAASASIPLAWERSPAAFGRSVTVRV
ncbi:MAG TPA: hypothetical protein VG015_06940 [Candidatus Dormibacteraeota bacterium]|jgi:hypothetical protein|nr:hypothetical protein [Candidatus Dormibacteraeota bacterium]